MKHTVQLEVTKEYLDKSMCLKKAHELIDNGQLQMEVCDCAREIFAHAMIFYKAKECEKYPIDLSLLKKHANPIDLEDGGDTLPRRCVYNAIWLIF